MISLKEAVGELGIVSNEMSVHLNRRTGEFVALNEEHIRAAEEQEEHHDLVEWQQAQLAIARQVLESDDYVTLPSPWGIHEYEIMRRFCLGVKDQRTSEDLLDAIRGSGAFRRFRSIVHGRNLQEVWYRFRDRALGEIAVEWLEENGLSYIKDLDTGE